MKIFKILYNNCEFFIIILNNLLQLLRKYDRGDIPKNEWLDTITFKKIDEIFLVYTISFYYSILIFTFLHKHVY